MVSDGGTDGTLKILKKLGQKNKNLVIVDNGKHLGYGATLRAGFAKAGGELIFYTDSDNQYDIKELDKLLPLIKRFDIVAGYRKHRQDSWSRMVTAWAYNLIIRWLLGLKVRDVDCSFKLYRKGVFEGIKLKSRTGLIDAEVLIKALKKGFSICQVGVTHYPRTRGETSYEIGRRNWGVAIVDPRVPLEIFKEIGGLWHEIRL